MHPIKSCLGLAAALLMGGPSYFNSAAARELTDPPVLSSQRGVLNLLLIARERRLPEVDPAAPAGWVYEACLRSDVKSDRCPPGHTYYGGVRLALQAGDTLNIHLINLLPAALASHAADPGESYLALNPTNLHTHGLLVSPHGPLPDDPTYGDNVFVLTFNPANGTPEASPHLHSAIRFGSTDYSIKVPATHPSGLYWFHPHAHGISRNQVASGMAGMITIGSPSDYLCADARCTKQLSGLPVRHMILKNMQVLADGSVQRETDPDFCTAPQGAAPIAGAGVCPGQNLEVIGGADYRGGRWIHSINGQVYPRVTVNAATGEIWRLLNASDGTTFDIELTDTRAGRALTLQLLSLDGVSIAPEPGLAGQTLTSIGGSRFTLAKCPGMNPGEHQDRSADPVCVSRLHMMPGTRAEVWVADRDASGRPRTPARGGDIAVLRTASYSTGPGGDTWPAIALAEVHFESDSTARARAAAAPTPDFLTVRGDARSLMNPVAVSGELRVANAAVGVDTSCRPLAPGHRRRIFFNAPQDNPDAFGLGYEEIDAKGRPVPGTFQDVNPFDPMRSTVCVPLGAGNTPVKEVWELVNIASEDHNFHLHQVHFRVVSAAEIDGTGVPTAPNGDGVMVDSVPLPHAQGSCNSVADWRAGACTAYPAVVEIPFAIAGDFVYHCHILEHEDGGMMARIRVRPTP